MKNFPLSSILNFLHFTVVVLGLCFETDRIRALELLFISLFYVHFYCILLYITVLRKTVPAF